MRPVPMPDRRARSAAVQSRRFNSCRIQPGMPCSVMTVPPHSAALKERILDSVPGGEYDVRMMRANSSRAVDRYVATANLAAVLEAQGRKQSWLAERLGVSKPLLCLIVSGTRMVDRARGDQIATALGVPFCLLFKLRTRSSIVSGRKTQPPPVTSIADV